MANVGPAHTLIVHKVGDSYSSLAVGEFEEYELIHPGECPHTYDEIMRCDYYTCAVGWNIDNAGLRFCLDYSGTPVTEPGTYSITAWAENIHYWEGVEFDGGIALIERGEPHAV